MININNIIQIWVEYIEEDVYGSVGHWTVQLYISGGGKIHNARALFINQDETPVLYGIVLF
jgi:hypothetical protein